MGPKPKDVKVKEEVIEEVVGERRVWIIQRDIATHWPCSDGNAEHVTVFEDYLSNLFDEGWKIEQFKVEPRRVLSENEFVIPVVVILTR